MSFSYLAGQNLWWMIIKLLFAAALILMLTTTISLVFFRFTFLLMRPVYWSMYRTQASLYLSKNKFWHVLKTCLHLKNGGSHIRIQASCQRRTDRALYVISGIAFPLPDKWRASFPAIA